MGVWPFGKRETASAPRLTFSQASPGTDGYFQWSNLVNHLEALGPVSRAQAMSVPAVKAAREKFTQLAAMPLHVYNAAGEKIESKLFAQPERIDGPTRSVTLAWTIDDLFHYGRSLWRVNDRDWTAYPTSVQRVPFGRYSIDKGTGTVMVDGTKVNPIDVILFVSPNDGLLTVGAGTIRALLILEQTALMNLSQPQAQEYFRSTSGKDPSPEFVQEFLNGIADARRRNASGWLPHDVERIAVDKMSPEQLQLTAAREFGISEVSRMTGVSPNWLALNITTRTYSNLTQERRDFVEGPALAFIKPIEERLSLGDVTPNGHRALFNFDSYLRLDTLDRMNAYKIGSEVGAYTTDEIRDLENRPKLPPTTESE